MRKVMIAIIIIIVGLFILSFIIQKETKPSKKTRIVLEHTYSTYVAPLCFNHADVTNYLGDGTLEEAFELDYEPHDQCTKDALKGEKEILFKSILKDIGIIPKKWDDW